MKPVKLSGWLQFAMAGLFALAVGWVWLAWRADAIGLALGGLALFVFGHALVLAAEFVMVWKASSADSKVDGARFPHLVAAWRSEVFQALRVFYWRQPFRSSLIPDDVGAGAGARRGVILVHGFMCNRGLWNPWMQRLRALGVPFLALDLEPVLAPIDQHADSIERAVQRMTEATGMAPVVAAHSMGGLVVRSWLAHGNSDSRVRRVITIGAPHRGTVLARFGLSANARQMRPGSAWLRALERAEPPERRRHFTCFFSRCDNVVFPASRAILHGADNRHVPGKAHLQLLESQAIFAEVLRWLACPPSDIEADSSPDDGNTAASSAAR